MIPLQDLPALEEAAFTPTTWGRLLSHIDSAITQVMQDWQSSLTQALASASSDHDLGRDMVQLRTVLARRVQLARHPSLPPRVRDALSADAEASIRRLQADIEEKISGSNENGKIDHSAGERLLSIVRTNSLVHVLGLEIDQDGSGARAAPLSVSAVQAEPDASAIPRVGTHGGNRSPRRVQFFDTVSNINSSGK